MRGLLKAVRRAAGNKRRVIPTRARVHGGKVPMTDALHFEAVFRPDEIRVYPYDGEQSPIRFDAGKGKPATGTVTIKYRDTSKAPKKLTLEPVAPEGADQDSLRSTVDLSQENRGHEGGRPPRRRA